MDRESRKQRMKADVDELDRAIQRATRLRATQQVIDLAEPTLPATGTDRVAALLAEARRNQREAIVADLTKADPVARTGAGTGRA
jgi:hypothetical protein